MPWAKTKDPNFLLYGTDVNNRIVLVLQLLEVLLNNNQNRQRAVGELNLGDMMIISLVVSDPGRRNNHVTPLFKQTLRIILGICDHKQFLNKVSQLLINACSSSTGKEPWTS